VIGAAGRDAWRILYSILFTGNSRDRFARVCDEFELSPAAAKALVLLGEGPCAMRDMAATFRCDPSYITGVVDVLERRGIAHRAPHPTDRRVKTVTLTDAGRETLSKAQAILWEPPASFGVLTDVEQRRLRDMLTKVANAEAATAEPSTRAG
jgi:DNA-binding MarR family transcriptional regulator